VGSSAAGTGVRVPRNPVLFILLPCLFYKLLFGKSVVRLLSITRILTNSIQLLQA